MDLPVLEVGSTAIVEERWDELLWSAVPHRVICSSRASLITFVPSGAVATYASSRGMSGTETLNRDQRKLQALRTRRARVVEVTEALDRLFIHRRDRWSRTSLGWDGTTGDFRGWYVNFEVPAIPTPSGVATMDLVLDLRVKPDRSRDWKD